MKKRKLNSTNPKYKTTEERGEKLILKRKPFCKAKIRTANGVWYE